MFHLARDSTSPRDSAAVNTKSNYARPQSAAAKKQEDRVPAVRRESCGQPDQEAFRLDGNTK